MDAVAGSNNGSAKKNKSKKSRNSVGAAVAESPSTSTSSKKKRKHVDQADVAVVETPVVAAKEVVEVDDVVKAASSDVEGTVALSKADKGREKKRRKDHAKALVSCRTTHSVVIQ